MTSLSSLLVIAAGLAFSAQALAQARFYEDPGFAGRSLSAHESVHRFDRHGLKKSTSSVVVVGQPWEVCEGANFLGRCTVLRPGQYPTPATMGLNNPIFSARVIDRNTLVNSDRDEPEPSFAQITFYEREGFDGRAFTATGPIPNFRRHGFNDRASSALVVGERWEVCNNNQYRGRCVVLRPGRYPTLASMGMNDEITSVRTVAGTGRIRNDRYAPPETAGYDSRRRNNERLFQTPVTSVHAVLAISGQRCWVEQEKIHRQGNNTNVPAALAGALIGGILGHQVGDGSGKDIATVGGILAGAALGAQFGDTGLLATQDVQRCENTPGGAQPAYWDVSYTFRGEKHRIQTATAPGNFVTVNERGEPRQ